MSQNNDFPGNKNLEDMVKGLLNSVATTPSTRPEPRVSASTTPPEPASDAPQLEVTPETNLFTAMGVTPEELRAEAARLETQNPPHGMLLQDRSAQLNRPLTPRTAIERLAQMPGIGPMLKKFKIVATDPDRTDGKGLVQMSDGADGEEHVSYHVIETTRDITTSLARQTVEALRAKGATITEHAIDDPSLPLDLRTLLKMAADSPGGAPTLLVARAELPPDSDTTVKATIDELMGSEARVLKPVEPMATSTRPHADLLSQFENLTRSTPSAANDARARRLRVANGKVGDPPVEFTPEEMFESCPVPLRPLIQELIDIKRDHPGTQVTIQVAHSTADHLAIALKVESDDPRARDRLAVASAALQGQDGVSGAVTQVYDSHDPVKTLASAANAKLPFTEMDARQAFPGLFEDAPVCSDYETRTTADGSRFSTGTIPVIPSDFTFEHLRLMFAMLTSMIATASANTVPGYVPTLMLQTLESGDELFKAHALEQHHLTLAQYQAAREYLLVAVNGSTMMATDSMLTERPPGQDPALTTTGNLCGLLDSLGVFPADTSAEKMTPEVTTGIEQALVHAIRSLALASGADYGDRVLGRLEQAVKQYVAKRVELGRPFMTGPNNDIIKLKSVHDVGTKEE